MCNVDWVNVSSDQILSETFIEKYQDKVHWGYILMCQKLSKEFKDFFDKKMMKEYFTSYAVSWRNKDIPFQYDAPPGVFA
jgi:hypothetical protein